MEFVNIADIPMENGLTSRQENGLKKHNIPLGTLVETWEGLRLYVASHDRDCDETPLYGLSYKLGWKEIEGMKFATRCMCDFGYAEESLTIIKETPFKDYQIGEYLMIHEEELNYAHVIRFNGFDGDSVDATDVYFLHNDVLDSHRKKENGVAYAYQVRRLTDEEKTKYSKILNITI